VASRRLTCERCVRRLATVLGWEQCCVFRVGRKKCDYCVQVGHNCKKVDVQYVTVFFFYVTLQLIFISGFKSQMLTTMPFQRLPEPTKTFINLKGEGRFNWSRNDNIDSLLAYMCGTVVPKKNRCERCESGNGIMKECVLVKGYMKGACSNCWKNSKQASCIYCKHSSSLHQAC
jgi:hypothetical protein